MQINDFTAEELLKSLEDLLNDALQKDSQWMEDLIAQRPRCGDLIAKHPTIQVGGNVGDYRAGMLGLLNGWLIKHGKVLHARMPAGRNYQYPIRTVKFTIDDAKQYDYKPAPTGGHGRR